MCERSRGWICMLRQRRLRHIKVLGRWGEGRQGRTNRQTGRVGSATDRQWEDGSGNNKRSCYSSPRPLVMILQQPFHKSCWGDSWWGSFHHTKHQTNPPSLSSQSPPRHPVRALRGAAGATGRAVQREDLQGGGDVLPGRPADRGGDVQQRGGGARLQRVPRPHRTAGATEGIQQVQSRTLQ